MVLLKYSKSLRDAKQSSSAVVDVAGTTSVQQPFSESPDLIK